MRLHTQKATGPSAQQGGRIPPCPGESVACAGMGGVRPPALLPVLQFTKEEYLGSPKSNVFESGSDKPGTLRVFSYLKCEQILLL